jgi:CubicO group peptidase (beta-lactamase class C family)
VPVTPYDGLQVAKETFDSAKIKELKAREAEDVFKDITSIVVLKNGKILIEEYFNKADRNTLHDVRSVGKTFASTIAGIAIRDRYLKNEYQTLKEFYNLRSFANYSPEKENTTIRELLTMSSVFEGNDNKGNSLGNEENMYPTPDWVKFTLDLPADTANADGRWHYFTAGVVLLGDILHKAVPGGLEAYAHQKLFKPLGITDYKWQYTPQKVANTAGGIRMNALDFARYAQLYKNGGKWNGKQILPKQWVDKSFTKIKSIPGRKNEYYGYLFWNKTYKVNGKEYETFYCAGNGGNHIYIFNELPLVVVVTAAAYNRPYAHSQVHTIMEEYVLPAVLGSK